jgi:RNA recognition motif-containing protein
VTRILARLFATHGTVLSAKVAVDRETRRSKGFGFVEMASEAETRTAITRLNGQEVDGRNLIVVEGKETQPNKREAETGRETKAGKRRSASKVPRKPAPLGKRLRRPKTGE